MLRGRREARREDRQELGRGGTADHYQMRQRLLSVGDDFWIENDRGERVHKVDGKALRLRQTLLFEDASGTELCRFQERKARVRDSMAIEGPGGERLAMVKKAMITSLRERRAVSVADGRVGRVGRVVGDVQPDVPPWNRLGYGNNAVEVAYVDVR